MTSTNNADCLLMCSRLFAGGAAAEKEEEKKDEPEEESDEVSHVFIEA